MENSVIISLLGNSYNLLLAAKFDGMSGAQATKLHEHLEALRVTINDLREDDDATE